VPEPGRQDKPETAVLDFLSCCMTRISASWSKSGTTTGRASARSSVSCRSGQPVVHTPQAFRQPAGAHHAYGHRLAVQNSPYPLRFRKHGQTYGRSSARHAARSSPARPARPRRPSSGSSGRRRSGAHPPGGDSGRSALLLQVLEERRVQDHPVLDHFRQPRTVFAIRQRVQNLGVDQHARRLPESPDQYSWRQAS